MQITIESVEWNAELSAELLNGISNRKVCRARNLEELISNPTLSNSIEETVEI